MPLFKKIIVLIYGILYAGLLCAQQNNAYQFAHIDFTQGLSHNQVNCMFKDQRGFIWFGTMSGLNRYDGYNIKIFRHTENDSASISDDLITNILEGPGRKLWIQTGLGFSIYDPQTEKFDNNTTGVLSKLGIPAYGLNDIVKSGKGYWYIYADSGMYYIENNKKILSLKAGTNGIYPNTKAITDVKTDSKGNLWIAHLNGLLEQVEPLNGKVMKRISALPSLTINAYIGYRLFVDADDELWVYCRGAVPGVYHIKPQDGTLTQYSRKSAPAALNNDIITGVVQDDKGLLWIATDHGGINIINKQSGSVFILQNKLYDNTSISQNSINAIYKDDLGIIWLGTYKRGISYYHETIFKFHLYRHQPSDAASLPYDDINKFLEDDKGNIWIGTNGDGLIYFDRAANTFTQYKHNAADASSLTNDVIVSLCIDHNNKLWVGTYFGGLDCFDGKIFKHFRHNAADTNSLADDRVWDIFEDTYNNLWIGTFESGMDRLDREKNIFIHYRPGENKSVHARYITQIIETKQKELWLATAYGIDRLDRSTGEFIHYNNASNKLSNDNIISILADSRGYIWAGSRDGLNVFNASTQKFQSFRTPDGLPDNSILNILEDDQHNLWISTPNGISRIEVKGNPDSGIAITCKNYDELDGLQGREFNQKAALKTKNGELVFGGANGFNIFKPSDIKTNKKIPPVIFTNLQVFNRNISAGEKLNDNVIIPNAISETNTITLKYNENVFSIEFAALSYINTQKNKYAYKLEGFNADWLITDASSRKVTYTNLDPGEYTFRVKASNDDGLWNEAGTAIKIIILPPFWETPLAYFIYVIIIVAILLFARRMIIQRAKMRFALEQERKEAQRMHELDMMKIRFFTNVSHEFRTPLSLILTPLERMIKSAAEPLQQKQYQLIHRNARRVLNLVNQLLDFRKMEVQELKLNTAEGDIAKFIKSISYSFTDIAEKKHIQFSYSASIETLYTKFDHDKIERILFNLLSNAFKFTSENGSVAVELNANTIADDALLEIKVRDTGIGIPADKQERIFERFFQHEIPGTLVNQGSGIGLAITKEFVKLHNGTVEVESEEDKGACFTILLPVKILKTVSRGETIVENDPDLADETPAAEESNNTAGNKKHTVLLVEDNEDFLFYLKDNLNEYYNIAEAKDGKEGWQKTLSVHPAIVVSDISMPVMNGIELCKKIKQDQRTKHIPVVLLTALAGEEQQIKGLETGAADYMTKPFNFEILLRRIHNLLFQQESLKQTFTRQVEVKTTEIKLDSPDEKFVQDALAITEKNISNADFSVEELSRALLMSRVAVYKRLFSLTGKTPIEFIRSVRLQRAAQLLEQSQMTVAEVAYETGFNNPKYFSKYFRAQYGMLPSVYQSSKKATAEKPPSQEE